MADVALITLSVARGSAKTYNGTHVTSGTDSTPVNITGWTILVTARDENARVVWQKTASVVSGAAGTYTWPLTASDTTISAKPYTEDIWRTDSGSETLMALGTHTITSEVRV